MTNEERAVIEAARKLFSSLESDPRRVRALRLAVKRLEDSYILSEVLTENDPTLPRRIKDVEGDIWQRNGDSSFYWLCRQDNGEPVGSSEDIERIREYYGPLEYLS